MNQQVTQHEDGTPEPVGDAGERPLAGRVALVAGATRGASRAIAVELGRAGAVVYATGRTTRDRVSEVGRNTETIEETADLVTAAGGQGVAVPTDHLEPAQVRALVERIDHEQGRLDILVIGVWGGDHLLEFDKKIWEIDLETGLRMIRLGIDAHLITSSYAVPLLIRRPGGLVIGMTDGNAAFNGSRYRGHLYFDLAKYAPIRMAFGLGEELKDKGCTAVALTPGFLRSEAMLDAFGVTEENWRDGAAVEPGFVVAESPVYVGRAAASLAADPEVARFNGQSLDSGQLAKEYGFTDVDGSQPDGWPYIAALMDGENPDVADYR